MGYSNGNKAKRPVNPRLLSRGDHILMIMLQSATFLLCVAIA